MARLHNKRGPMHEINVVPYVDVTLVRRVIVMVTAPLVTPGVVDLPSVSKASNAPTVPPLEVIVKEDQSLTLRDRDPKGGAGTERKLTRTELAQAIREQQARNPDRPVVISADKAVRYEAVLNVMDELQKQSVKRVGLMVKPAQ